MQSQLRIYVAGPLHPGRNTTRKEVLENVQKAIDVGIALYRKGHRPFIPHLFHYLGERARKQDIELTSEDFMRWDNTWLEQCDGLYFIGISKGSMSEYEIAMARGMRIFTELDDVPQVPDTKTYKEILGGYLADTFYREGGEE